MDYRPGGATLWRGGAMEEGDTAPVTGVGAMDSHAITFILAQVVTQPQVESVCLCDQVRPIFFILVSHTECDAD